MTWKIVADSGCDYRQLPKNDDVKYIKLFLTHK